MNRFRFFTVLSAILALGFVSQANAAEKTETKKEEKTEKTAHGMIYTPQGPVFTQPAIPAYQYQYSGYQQPWNSYYNRSLVPSSCAYGGCNLYAPRNCQNGYCYPTSAYPAQSPIYQYQNWGSFYPTSPTIVPQVQYLPAPTTNATPVPNTLPVQGTTPYLAGTPTTVPVNNPFFP